MISTVAYTQYRYVRFWEKLSLEVIYCQYGTCNVPAIEAALNVGQTNIKKGD